MVTWCNQSLECNQIHLFSAVRFALSAKSFSPPPHLVPISPSLTPNTLSWLAKLTLWFWRRKQTEQVPSWKQDSILGRTVDFELYALYLWKRHTNWKIRPPRVEEPQGSYLDSPSPEKKYRNYLCNQIESWILLCLLGYDHRTLIIVHC